MTPRFKKEACPNCQLIFQSPIYDCWHCGYLNTIYIRWGDNLFDEASIVGNTDPKFIGIFEMAVDAALDKGLNVVTDPTEYSKIKIERVSQPELPDTPEELKDYWQ